MLKRFGNIVLLLLVAVNATYAFTIGDYVYSIVTPSSNTVSIKQRTTADKSITTVEIPEQVVYDETVYTVIEIVSLAFENCSNLQSITIPASINTIYPSAFNNNTSLRTMVYYGSSAIFLSKVLNTGSTSIDLHVLSTAAKESFESNSNWTNSLHAITVDGVSIAEGTNNATTLEKHSGHTADVELTRTINAGGYNSLCLPFAVNAELVEAVFGSDCDIQELTSATIDAGGIDLQFTKRTAMAAGRPYLVKPAATVSNPTFTNVVLTNEVSSTQTTDVDFIGIFSPTDMEASENTLVMGSGSTLHPTAAGTMPGLRGYFVLKTSGAKTAAKKQIRTHFGTTDAATSVENSCTPMENNAHKRLVNGQLHIIRNGVHYNAQGAIIE